MKRVGSLQFGISYKFQATSFILKLKNNISALCLTQFIKLQLPSKHIYCVFN